MAGARGRPKHSLDSLDNALRLLLLFRDRTTVRVSDAADALELGRSTVHRIVTTLQYRGFVEQDEDTREYRLGPALLQVRVGAVSDFDIRRVARGHLEQLCKTVGETTHLVVLKRASSIFIDSVESDRPLRTTSRVGQVLPAHGTSGGKALLAELSAEELRKLYPRERLKASTARTITSRTTLEQELERVRRRGYATSYGEAEPDIHAVGVAIPADRRRVNAAIAVSGPASRFTEGAVKRVSETAIEAARGVAADLV